MGLHDRRKEGSLFSDIDKVMEADLYSHMSIMQNMQARNHGSAEA